MNLIRSILCWVKNGGHTWRMKCHSPIQSAQGRRGQIWCCIKCDMEIVRRTNQVGVK